jgi:hypothetical protein
MRTNTSSDRSKNGTARAELTGPARARAVPHTTEACRDAEQDQEVNGPHLNHVHLGLVTVQVLALLLISGPYMIR